MLSAQAPSHANIHSPQGALDVAGILPGKYTFLDALKNTPATMQKPLAAKANNEEDDPSDQLTSINELIGLMRQATETSAMIAAEDAKKAEKRPPRRNPQPVQGQSPA